MTVTVITGWARREIKVDEFTLLEIGDCSNIHAWVRYVYLSFMTVGLLYYLILWILALGD